ncbi:MAG: hypothetical protein P4L42_16570 [Desulfocapsaceae bacterium]|nr:hypothetical protein [Desulfocapsaceae bacterium]
MKSAYDFNEEQTTHMTVSAARSLREAFLSVDGIRWGDNECSKIADIAHGLKGLLLNMGQPEWAGYVKEIETGAHAGESRNYKEMFDTVRVAVRDVCEVLKERQEETDGQGLRFGMVEGA